MTTGQLHAARQVAQIAQQSRADLEAVCTVMLSVKAHFAKEMEQWMNLAAVQIEDAKAVATREAQAHSQCKDALRRAGAEIIELTKAAEVHLTHEMKKLVETADANDAVGESAAQKADARASAAEKRVADLILEADIRDAAAKETDSLHLIRVTEQANLRVAESERRLTELQERAAAEQIESQRRIDAARESALRAEEVHNKEVARLQSRLAATELVRDRCLLRSGAKYLLLFSFSRWARNAGKVRDLCCVF